MQFGANGEKVYKNTIDLVGKTTINQIPYLIRTSLLHLGADSFPAHIASVYNKNIVALYSNNYISCVKPFFGDDKKKILLEPDRKTKPVFSFEENPKSINTIPPEKIAQSVLDLLNIDYKINVKTVAFGSHFNNQTLEIIPDGVVNPNEFGSNNIVVRMDYLFNENALNAQLGICPCLVLTNKPINKDILLQHKKNVQTVIFFLTSSKDVDFVSFLQYNGFNYQIVTALNDKELDDVKLDFIDYDVNRLISRNKDEFGDPSNLYFKTNKMLLSGGKVYNSKINWINGIEGMHEYNKVIDSPDFWDEVEHFYLCRIN